MISHKYKCIFIHIPKTAGNSVKHTLGIEGHSHFSHYEGYHVSVPFASFGGELANNPTYYVFAFVRNPWDRFVSAYTYMQASSWEMDIQTRDRYIKPTKSFSEFVQCMTNPKTNMTKNCLLRHFWPQSYYIRCTVDFIGRLENLQEDFNIVCDKIGIPKQQLPHKNKSKHKHYTEYYDDETMKIVAELYKEDIDRFGYEFGGKK